MEWNTQQKPKSIYVYDSGVTVTYTYYGSGERASMDDGTTESLYFGDLYEKRGGTAVRYIFLGPNRIATVYGGDTTFTHGDHLGSGNIVTDDSGNLEVSFYNMPYGQQYGGDEDASHPYRFTGQEQDLATGPDDGSGYSTGFYNYGARMYDPVIGRFLSPDSIVPEPMNPQALNRYSYCLNNPLRYVDPSGHNVTDKQRDEYARSHFNWDGKIKFKYGNAWVYLIDGLELQVGGVTNYNGKFINSITREFIDDPNYGEYMMILFDKSWYENNTLDLTLRQLFHEYSHLHQPAELLYESRKERYEYMDTHNGSDMPHDKQLAEVALKDYEYKLDSGVPNYISFAIKNNVKLPGLDAGLRDISTAMSYYFIGTGRVNPYYGLKAFLDKDIKHHGSVYREESKTMANKLYLLYNNRNPYYTFSMNFGKIYIEGMGPIRWGGYFNKGE